MTDTTPETELHTTPDGISWGMKSWRENGVPHYLIEAHFRVPSMSDDEPTIYAREKRVGDPLGAIDLPVVPELVARLVRILTEPEFRQEIYENVKTAKGV